MHGLWTEDGAWAAAKVVLDEAGPLEDAVVKQGTVLRIRELPFL